jgi:hypothetical protein
MEMDVYYSFFTKAWRAALTRPRINFAVVWSAAAFFIYSLLSSLISLPGSQLFSISIFISLFLPFGTLLLHATIKGYEPTYSNFRSKELETQKTLIQVLFVTGMVAAVHLLLWLLQLFFYFILFVPLVGSFFTYVFAIVPFCVQLVRILALFITFFLIYDLSLYSAISTKIVIFDYLQNLKKRMQRDSFALFGAFTLASLPLFFVFILCFVLFMTTPLPSLGMQWALFVQKSFLLLPISFLVGPCMSFFFFVCLCQKLKRQKK